MRVDLQAEIDEAPIGKLHFIVPGLCFCVLFLDGLDLQIISYTAPLIAADLGITDNRLGWIFSAGLAGTAVGPFLLAPLGDYIGRKKTLIISLIVFGGLVFLTPFADSLWALMAIRFFTGIGLGGAIPNALTLVAEIVPVRHRGLTITFTYIGFILGGAAAGVLVIQALQWFDWKAAFYISGALPMGLGLVLLWALPESLHFLVKSGKKQAEVARLLSRLTGTRNYPEGIHFHLKDGATKTSVASLFSGGRGRNTILLWLAMFVNVVALFGLLNWAPTLIAQAGGELDRAIWLVVYFWGAGAFGALALVWLSRRFGTRKMLVAYLLAGSVFVAGMGANGTEDEFIVWMAIFAGFFAAGGQIGFYPILVQIYPAPIRVMGIGWAQGWGRMGGIAGPLVIGGLVAANLPFGGYFLVMGVPILLSGIAVLFLHYKQ